MSTEKPNLPRRLLRPVLHPVRSLRHWWATIVYTYGCDPQTASDRITSRQGWPEW